MFNINDNSKIKTAKITHKHTHTHIYIYIYIYIYTHTLTKWLEKKLDGNYTRMLRAILNKSWQQHPTRCQLYGHLPPITKTIQARRTRHARHCWRSKDELVSDVLLWTPAYGQSKAGRPARTYIQQLCDDMGCNPDDLPEAMNRDRGSGISVLAARHDDDDDMYIEKVKRKKNIFDDLFICQRISTSIFFEYMNCKWIDGR